MTTPRRRSISTIAAVLAATAALGACTSNPSNRRVVQDIIESLDMPEPARECMLALVGPDGDYDNDALNEIANANKNFALTPDGEIANPSEGLATFQADLASCLDGTDGSEVPGSEVPGSEPASTEPAGSAPVSTEPADSAPATTDAP